MKTVRVLAIDNSILFLEDLAGSLLKRLPKGSLVEKATESQEALDKIVLLHPDVIVLNYAMSLWQINGVRLLSLLSDQQDAPIIAYGALSTGKDSALRAGASDYIVKPGSASPTAEFVQELVSRIESAVENVVKPITATTKTPSTMKPGAILTRSKWQAQKSLPKEEKEHNESPPFEFFLPPKVSSTKKDFVDLGKKITLIAIGSSTGGTEALSTIMKMLYPPLPPIVIAQHIPPLFAKLFAQRLDDECKLHVKEGEDGEVLLNNTVYVAPGNKHMTVSRAGSILTANCIMGPRVHSCRPAVDVLFDSVATHVGASTLGVILTGMGHDGAAGLLKIRETGAPTLGQNEATCVVYGMPRAAFEIGAVEKQLPLEAIADAIMHIARDTSRT